MVLLFGINSKAPGIDFGGSYGTKYQLKAIIKCYKEHHLIEIC